MVEPSDHGKWSTLVTMENGRPQWPWEIVDLSDRGEWSTLVTLENGLPQWPWKMVDLNDPGKWSTSVTLDIVDHRTNLSPIQCYSPKFINYCAPILIHFIKQTNEILSEITSSVKYTWLKGAYIQFIHSKGPWRFLTARSIQPWDLEWRTILVL